MNSVCRRTIDLYNIQRWCLMGMSSTHRAIVRRSAQSIFDTFVQDKDATLQIQWQVVESLAPATYASWCDALLGNDVALLDLSSSEPMADLTKLKASIERTPSTVRLLWCWGARERAPLAFQSFGIAHGMIFDLQSLESWLRIAFRKAAWHPAQANPLLAGIELPNL